MVDGQQNHGLHELCLNDRAAHGDNRLTREDRRALRHGPDIAREAEAAQILQEPLVKHLPACPPAQPKHRR